MIRLRHAARPAGPWAALLPSVGSISRYQRGWLRGDLLCPPSPRRGRKGPKVLAAADVRLRRALLGGPTVVTMSEIATEGAVPAGRLRSGQVVAAAVDHSLAAAREAMQRRRVQQLAASGMAEPAGPPIRVFLLDDHEIVRRGVAELLGGEPDLEVVGDASTAAEAISRVPAVRPDVAVLDVRLPDGDGVTVCRELRSRVPELRCLMLTSFADDDALFDAIMAGAAGYVLKQIRGSDLVGAIRTVAGGQSLLDRRTTVLVLQRVRSAVAHNDPLAALSEQEHTVLDLIGEGLTNREIGERMFLAEKTVKNYVSSLLNKLGLERRTQAAILAVKLHEKG